MPLYFCSLRLIGLGVLHSFCQLPAFSKLLVICCVIHWYISFDKWCQVTQNEKKDISPRVPVGCFFNNFLKQHKTGASRICTCNSNTKKSPGGLILTDRNIPEPGGQFSSNLGRGELDIYHVRYFTKKTGFIMKKTFLIREFICFRKPHT